ncbi:hypothetical protein G6F35_013475 [Rhizopus arrhizus]|nr:hypothetical protein G6F35_013475 [Rhizopus arrhizus]
MGERFLEQHRDWLALQLRQYQGHGLPAPLQPGEDGVLPLRGELLPLRWQEGRYARLEIDEHGACVQWPSRRGAATLRRPLREFDDAQPRAGEQGRGFAVVASEVRTLAQRSAGAAKEIKGLIEDSVGKVADGSALVRQAGTTMGEIVASVQRVTDIMADISAASQEQTECGIGGRSQRSGALDGRAGQPVG